MTPDEREEIKRHFDVVAEGLHSEIRQVAEGVAMNTKQLERLDGRVGGLEGRADRLEMEFRAFRGEMYAFRDETRHNFAELRSMIKLSYAELDRRLTTLEASHGELAARMARVEAKLAS